MRRWGLHRRVVVASVGMLALGLAVLTATANLLLSDRLDSDANAVLRARAAAQLATLGVQDGRVVVREGPGDQVLDQHAWVFAGGREVEHPAAPAAVQRAAAGLARTRTPRRIDAAGDVRLLAEPAYDRGGRRIGTVVAGLSLVPYEDTEHIGLLASIALSLFVLVAGALVARLAVRAALRPVAQMAARATDWSEHDLDRRFDLGRPHDELTGLADTLDGMLARIAATLRHEQRFSAEVAHELRTPLAGIRAEAELGLAGGSVSDTRREALERIVAITERMDASIETLMTLGRQELDPGVASADALAAASAAADACRPAARARDVELRVSSANGSALAAAPAEAVVQALNPLLDNAVRHARQTVDVEVGARHTNVEIAVSDDGPGVSPEMLETIFDPGVRRGDHDGAGLGLPLARRLARACGGDVSAQRATGGRFVLRLPAVTGSRQGP
jgi:signal transduction histidine kinase